MTNPITRLCDREPHWAHQREETPDGVIWTAVVGEARCHTPVGAQCHDLYLIAVQQPDPPHGDHTPRIPAIQVSLDARTTLFALSLDQANQLAQALHDAIDTITNPDH